MSAATWQRGHTLEELRTATAPFKASDRGYVLGAFTGFKERDVADALTSGRYLSCTSGEVTNALPAVEPDAAVVYRVASSRQGITDFTGRRCAEVLPGDVVVQRLGVQPGKEASASVLLRHLRGVGAGAMWLTVWQESGRHAGVLELLGWPDLAAVKIPASSELVGIYHLGAARDIVPLPETEEYGLRRLALDVPQGALERARAAVEALDPAAFADHYSGYNKGHAWSAVALRGYGDASDIEKPAEMSKRWKADHPDWQSRACADTAARAALPDLEPLISLVPGDHQRIRLMRLQPGGGELTRHADITDPEAGTVDGKVLRIHIPLLSNPRVLFSSWTLDGQQYRRHMAPGTAWYLDTRKPHTARNDGETERIHLVIDAYSSPELLRMLREGRVMSSAEDALCEETWEQRMAVRAAERHAAADALAREERARFAALPPVETDEERVARVAREWTGGPPEPIPCACVGPPRGCSLCPCRVVSLAWQRRKDWDWQS